MKSLSLTLAVLLGMLTVAQADEKAKAPVEVVEATAEQPAAEQPAEAAKQ